MSIDWLTGCGMILETFPVRTLLGIFLVRNHTCNVAGMEAVTGDIPSENHTAYIGSIKTGHSKRLE